MSRSDERFIREAKLFALAAHSAISHARKYSGEPYFTHLEAVAGYLRADGQDALTVAAGYLHDVIEDTGVTHGVLVDAFGRELADLVLEVSDPPHPDGMRRAERAERNRLHYAAGSHRAHSIKAADITHNLQCMVGYAPLDFATLWFGEKQRVRPDLVLASPRLLEKLDFELSRAAEYLASRLQQDARGSFMVRGG